MRIRVHRAPGVLLLMLCLVAVAPGLEAGLPAAASADATIAPAPVYSSAPGLPDGRVYEEVSPPNKYGNQAGARFGEFGTTNEGESVATADGNAVLFYGEGAMGEAASGLDSVYVAQHSLGGWSTRSALPAPAAIEEAGGAALLSLRPLWVDPSVDLTHVMFTAQTAYLQEPPYQIAGNGGNETAPEVNHFANVYLAGSNPLAPPTWIAKPGSGNVTIPRQAEFAPVPVGGTPDMSTAYFAYPGTLGLPEDAPRAQHVASEMAWGFFEYRNGALSDAGVLPDGSVSPFGAVPAGLASVPGNFGRSRVPAGELNNEVSADGSRAFFVSPDPSSSEVTDPQFCEETDECTTESPQLYVRETAPDGSQSTVLASRDTLLPEVGGQPAIAPGGATFAYASPDGSHVFFTSPDQLTTDSTAGLYDFDTTTNSLAKVTLGGGILASSADGSRVFFDSGNMLSMWSAGPAGGTVTPIWEHAGASPARATDDGSVFVFMDSGVPGFNDAASEIFRYDVKSNSVSCVSCPPVGITPSGAVLSNLAARGAGEDSGEKNGAVENRAISADGSRVFFDTSDPLVPQDANGKFDVYEWENGTIFLISSGTGIHDSLLMDNSSSGNDLFFTTADGLVPGDTEGGYDVYDARVPHPGDNPPPSAVPCQGDVCQGSPSVPALLGAPSSATFDGLGNIVQQPTTGAVKKKTTKKTTGEKRRKRSKKRRGKAHRPSRKVTKSKRRGK